MGQRGPRKKPTRLKLLHGTEKKRTARDVQPKSYIPKAPSFLDEVALEEWNRVAEYLYELNLLSNLDVVALALYCDSYAQYLAMRKQVKRYGAIVKVGDEGYKQISPYFTAMLQLSDQVKKYLVEFGMTPNSRQGMRVDNPWSTGRDSKLLEMRNAGRLDYDGD